MADGRTRRRRCLAAGWHRVSEARRTGEWPAGMRLTLSTLHSPHTCVHGTHPPPARHPPTSPNGLSKGKCVYIMHAGIDNG